MSRHSSTIKHLGVVDEVTERTICVSITSMSACNLCYAKGACSMAEQVDKRICIPNSGVHVVKGETVNVVMEASAGIQSVFLAYVIPVILLVFGIVLFSILSFPDFVSALLSLAAVAVYYFILFLMRRALEKKFVMRIEKL